MVYIKINKYCVYYIVKNYIQTFMLINNLLLSLCYANIMSLYYKYLYYIINTFIIFVNENFY